MSRRFLEFRDSEPLALDKIPLLQENEFRNELAGSLEESWRIVNFFGVASGPSRTRIYALIADDPRGFLGISAFDACGEFNSMTPDFPQMHLFEREVFEQFGVRPKGHPCLKPVRFQSRMNQIAATDERPVIPGGADFFRIDGEDVHEVAVGPVHAGVIEPGHFRFQCLGEDVLHLEISLGYQHRGIEKRLLGAPRKDTMHLIETAAGDSTVANATAYCMAIEALAGMKVPLGAEYMRAIGLELERLANHAGDLGALAGDIGFQSTSSYCGRIRGDFLNITALLCGNRFGRGLVRPGGTPFMLDAQRAEKLGEALHKTYADLKNAVELLWDNPSVLARFENAGRISIEDCLELGIVGVPARACGLERDLRQDFPSGLYQFSQIPVSVCSKGNVFSRAFVRWLEAQRSYAFISENISALPDTFELCQDKAPDLLPDSLVATLCEGWRGEISHVAITDQDGRFARYKICDPSFHNWSALAIAMRDQLVSDFPLCNKSFNLSYCGHDL